MTALPTLFISHGAPTLAMEPEAATARFLGALGPNLAPEAIVCVTAHWETRGGFAASAAQEPEMIYDFRGFPDEMYRKVYPAPGAPDVARRAVELAREAGLTAEADARRGFDHGVWVPLSLMFPDATVPVVSMSVALDRTPAEHFALGQALRPLRDEGVLIVGSGNATHNLRALFDPRARNAMAEPTRAFSDWLQTRIASGETDALTHYAEEAPYALENHPTPDHILPLFVPLGAASDPHGERLHDDYAFEILSMAAYRWD